MSTPSQVLKQSFEVFVLYLSASGDELIMLDLSASVGGEIQSLSWDPRGERLAVLLKGLSHLFFCSPQ